MACRGHRIVSTATSEPLATREIAVNLKQPKVIPDYVAVEVDVPDDGIIILERFKLHAGIVKHRLASGRAGI
jgi:transcription antitermination factor NusG